MVAVVVIIIIIEIFQNRDLRGHIWMALFFSVYVWFDAGENIHKVVRNSWYAEKNTYAQTKQPRNL